MESNLTESNQFVFDDIFINQSEEFEVEISEEVINNFADISGDFNPIHMNNLFAAKTPFEKRIVHGMLLASFFSRLVGMKLPGKNGVYFSQSLNFRKPCFIGEFIKVVGTVIEKSESTKIITIKTEIFTKNNECIIDGEAKVLFYK